MNGQDDLLTRKHVADEMQMILEIPNDPRVLVGNIFTPQNAVSATMVMAGR